MILSPASMFHAILRAVVMVITFLAATQVLPYGAPSTDGGRTVTVSRRVAWFCFFTLILALAGDIIEILRRLGVF